jgi:hypothetical protein
VPNFAIMLRNPPGEDTLYKYVSTYDSVASAKQAVEKLKITNPGAYEIWTKGWTKGYNLS